MTEEKADQPKANGWCRMCLHPAHVGVCDVPGPEFYRSPASPLTTAYKCRCVAGPESVL